MNNLLTDSLIRSRLRDGAQPRFTLPGTLAALARNEIAAFPGLRPHQDQAWHCFLCQLAALALHRADRTDLPEDDATWRAIIRALTPHFPKDEPWSLIVDDPEKPAFLQPPEPDGIRYTGRADTPNALDMLLTSKNHEIKTNLARDGQADDWLFALLTQQTLDGFNGQGNFGIARMNGGSSSRVSLGLAPADESAPADIAVLPGGRWAHDVDLLLYRREELLDRVAHLDFPRTRGHALLWTLDWPLDDKTGLPLQSLDIWFIEICRRIRLRATDAQIWADTGTSKGPRVAAKAQNGVVGDPWAPVERKGHKTLTLSERAFDYRLISRIVALGEFDPPVMLRPREDQPDASTQTWLLIAQAIGRGNSKTYGYQERVIPVPADLVDQLAPDEDSETLNEVTKDLVENIGALEKIFAHALALISSSGEATGREDFAHANPWRDRLDAYADAQFFPTLWPLLRARQADDQEKAEATKNEFLHNLIDHARRLFEQAAQDLPTIAAYRHRAEARGRRRLEGGLRKAFPDAFAQPQKEEAPNAA